MSVPSRRRRSLHRAQRVSGLVSFGFAVAAVFALAYTFQRGGSPLWAAATVYGATVAYGTREMLKLRERTLFRPGGPPPPHSALLWWLLRLTVVVLVSSLPAVMLLGGLAAR